MPIACRVSNLKSQEPGCRPAKYMSYVYQKRARVWLRHVGRVKPIDVREDVKVHDEVACVTVCESVCYLLHIFAPIC